MNKAELRRSFLQQRSQLSPQQWQQLSKRICEHLMDLPLFQQATTVLAYFSIRQEPDLSLLFHDQHQWGFPRCVGQILSWRGWKPGEVLETSTFGIPEPLAASPILSSDQVDLILVPAVACDFQGYRLGYGGGFYDRLLGDPQWSRKPTIGITFAFAHVPKLAIDPWDRPLTGVCTEAGITLVTG